MKKICRGEQLASQAVVFYDDVRLEFPNDHSSRRLMAVLSMNRSMRTRSIRKREATSHLQAHTTMTLQPRSLRRLSLRASLRLFPRIFGSQ